MRYFSVLAQTHSPVRAMWWLTSRYKANAQVRKIVPSTSSIPSTIAMQAPLRCCQLAKLADFQSPFCVLGIAYFQPWGNKYCFNTLAKERTASRTALSCS